MSVIRLALFAALAVSAAAASNERTVTAVFSRTYNGYQRPKAADGSFEPQYYALANGIYSPGASADRSIDPVKFPQVAGLVAQFLALRNYRFAQESKQAAFLVVISWGKTLPFSDAVQRANTDQAFAKMNQFKSDAKTLKALEDEEANGGQARTRGPDGAASRERIMAQDALNDFQNQIYQVQMSEDMRRQADEHNARLLGYIDEINRRDTPSRFGGAGTAYDDLYSDIENERYYFVISAYDFATAKKGERKLLWATHVSVQAQGNRFNEIAAYMLAKASKYFGQDSGRLVREFEREGQVKLGELQVVGVVPEGQVTVPPDGKK